MLDACRAWIAEEAAYYGIPNVKIGPDQIRAGQAGVCGHADCVQAGLGGSHTDPGPNFPWDRVVGGSAPGPTPPPQEVDEMWVVDGLVPAGTGRGDAGTLTLALPQGRKSARLLMYCGGPVGEGVSLWAAQTLNGKKFGMWNKGNTWEMWLTAQKPFTVDLMPEAYTIEFSHMGGTKAPLAVSVAGI
jgi:hypothetical protein